MWPIAAGHGSTWIVGAFSARQAGVGAVALMGESGAKIAVVADLPGWRLTVLRITTVVGIHGRKGQRAP